MCPQGDVYVVWYERDFDKGDAEVILHSTPLSRDYPPFLRTENPPSGRSGQYEMELGNHRAVLCGDPHFVCSAQLVMVHKNRRKFTPVVTMVFACLLRYCSTALLLLFPIVQAK